MATHGGARPGAGRKRGEFTKDMSSLLKRTVSPDDWLSVMRALVARAAEGDVRAIQLLIRCRYGTTKDGAHDDEYLSVIRIIDPNDPDGSYEFPAPREVEDRHRQ